MMEDSLKKRFLYKLGINVLGFPMSLLTQTLVPRLLGPAGYGSFSFLSGFFMNVTAFLDTGTSTCFCTKLTQRPGDEGLRRFFARLFGLLSAGLVLMVAGGYLLGWDGVLWPEQRPSVVWLAAMLGVCLWLVQVLGRVVDAYALTVGGEMLRLGQRLVGLLFLLGLFLVDWRGLEPFFGCQILSFLALTFAWQRFLQRRGIWLLPPGKLTGEEWRAYGREFWVYSSPLIVHMLIALVAGIADRWLLQRFGGNLQQSYFGLGYQISALCLLLSGMMTPLFGRELAKAAGEQDLARMQQLFRSLLPLFFTLTALVSIFLASQAGVVTQVFGGQGYEDARTAVTLMVLVPIHQTYGQMCISYLYATSRTHLYRNIGATGQVLGLALTFLLLAPTALGGWKLGSTGLALKSVLLEVISVNILLWFSVRSLKLSYLRFLWHQAFVLLAFGSGAWFSGRIVSLFAPSLMVGFISNGALYFAYCMLLVAGAPFAIGMKHQELHDTVVQGFIRLKRLMGGMSIV